jgi:hypothetical protein
VKPARIEPRPLDVVAVLRLALSIFWRDFAPIIILGLMFLTLPAIAARTMMGAGSPLDPSVGTLAETFRWLLVMIFISAVTGGILAQLGGRRVGTSAFIRAGLRSMQPGIVVALIIGAVLVTLRIAFLLVSNLLLSAGGGALLFFLCCIALFAVWAVAIPAALLERKLPLVALKRSADLTRGNRWRLAGLFLVLALGLLPPIMFVRLVIFGAAATPLEVSAIAERMTVTSPGLWIAQLTNLLIFGLLSVVPAVLYLVFAGPTWRNRT